MSSTGSRRSSTSPRRARARPRSRSPWRVSASGRQPSRVHSQPTSSRAETVESARWRTEIFESVRARRAATRGRRPPPAARARACSAARRGRRSPRARRARQMRSSAVAGSGSSTASSRTTWASGMPLARGRRQRVDGLGVPVRRPDGGAQVRDDERVDDRVEVARCCSPTVTMTSSRMTANSPGLRRAVRRDRRLGVDRRAPGLDGADDGARRVVAPDAAQPVGDLAAPLAVDDADEVQRPRGDALLGLRVALGDEVAQRLLDRRRRACPARSRPRRSWPSLDHPPAIVVEQELIGLRAGPASPPGTAPAGRASAPRPG